MIEIELLKWGEKKPNNIKVKIMVTTKIENSTRVYCESKLDNNKTRRGVKLSRVSDNKR